MRPLRALTTGGVPAFKIRASDLIVWGGGVTDLASMLSALPWGGGVTDLAVAGFGVVGLSMFRNWLLETILDMYKSSEEPGCSRLLWCRLLQGDTDGAAALDIGGQLMDCPVPNITEEAPGGAAVERVRAACAGERVAPCIQEEASLEALTGCCTEIVCGVSIGEATVRTRGPGGEEVPVPGRTVPLLAANNSSFLAAVE